MRMIPAVGKGALAALLLGAMPGCASLGEAYPKVVGEIGHPRKALRASSCCDRTSGSTMPA